MKKGGRWTFRWGVWLLLIGLVACGGPPVRDPGPVPDAVPKVEPRSRYGNPDSYSVFGKRYFVEASSRGYVERGIASWYGEKFHGRRTSSGEPYDMYAMTAAHKSLPLPTYARVTNLENGRTAVVRINDRGPFVDNRIIDLSYAAAHKLDIVAKGTGLVEVRAIDPERPAPPAPEVAAADDPEIFLQIGAFTRRRNAERLQSRLLRHDIGTVAIHAAEHDARPLFRVRLGPLDTVEAADRVAVQLEEIGMRDHHVVIE